MDVVQDDPWSSFYVADVVQYSPGVDRAGMKLDRSSASFLTSYDDQLDFEQHALPVLDSSRAI